MDKIKALTLEEELKGTNLSGFEVLELINYGKSAAVFKSEKNGEMYALKIFDNELIERFGHEIQTKRIEQEISLKNHKINNLVKIYEGGNTTVNNLTYYYLVMELIEGVNLKDFINNNVYEQDFILDVLDKLINTTEQLLNLQQIVHRDIKPENIMVRKDGQIVLMDLGVLKFVGAESFSDEEEKSFVGTLRYAPPEFLLRAEENSVNGWKAVNIYQIGATLHDLIMKCELFHDKNPYTNLVIAIKDDMPKIINNSLPYDLLQLTRDMMAKDPQKRLLLITDERLTRVISLKNHQNDSFQESIEELLKMRIPHQEKFYEIDKLKRTKEELQKRQKEISQGIEIAIDNCFDNLKNNNIFKFILKSKSFVIDDEYRNKEFYIHNFLYELKGDLIMGFPNSLFILVKSTNNDLYYSEINVLGIFPGSSSNSAIEKPVEFYDQNIKKMRRTHLNYPNNSFIDNHNINMINIFKGIVEFDDSFTKYLSEQMVKLIKKALKSVEEDVKIELNWLEKRVKSNDRFNVRIINGGTTKIIDSL